MRKTIELDYLLENAVASALGLSRPHPELGKKVRLARRKPAHRATGVAATARHRERARAAA